MNNTGSPMPAPHQREEALFTLAVAKPAAERAAFLDRECAGDPALRQGVEALLAAHEDPDSFLVAPPAPAVPTIKLNPAADPKDDVGQTIGRYKLLEKVGEGGCGVVYVAEQTAPVRRRVALKVIKLGMDTKAVVARFEAERQALAMMDHPNIAKVLDAGATEAGRLYFVMELVRGIRVTDYCDQNHLSTPERLDLFLKVCQAIQHAHQKGIIHRDIKPSNILVTLHDGVPVPKVIDFGIAKATEGRLSDATVYTQLHQFIGTPAYMSPEQAEMSGLDIDTRSDIYSLGVLLYELLTGRTPFDAQELAKEGLEAIRRTIREVEPPRPSTRLSTLQGEALTATAKQHGTEGVHLLKLIRGDLDWIVMKCLEKDRTRRYDTANGLAMDLRRHLENEPVVARPPSAAYRLQKAWRRHKTAFTSAALMAAVLVAATGISAWQAVRATRAEALAKQRLAESEAITKFLTDVFQSPDPARNGRTITVAETLGAAAKKLETDLVNQPARRAKLQATLGKTYDALGLYREAIPLQEKVRDYYLAASGPEHPDTLGAMHNLANSYAWTGRWDEALKLRETVLALRRKVLGPEHPETIGTMPNLALSYFVAGRRDEAIKLFEEALTLRRKVNGPEHPDTLRAMSVLANSYDQAGRRDEALKLRGEVLPLRRKVNGPEHPDTLAAMTDLANSYDAAGRRDEALKLREELLALRRKVSGPAHPDTAVAMRNLAISYTEAGRHKEAIVLLEKACELDPKNSDVSLTLATWQTWFGQDADYEATRRRLVQQAEGTDQADTAHRAAKAYCMRPSTDATLLTKALDLAQRSVERGKGDYSFPSYQQELGVAEYRNGQYAAAEESLTIAEQTVGPNPDIKGTACLFRAMSLFRQNKPEEARKLFSQAEAQMPPPPKDESKPLVDGMSLSHDVLIYWLAYKEAKSVLNEPGPTKP
jgi:serine/threonine protein kinase/tetratricopeptide (TPR) repeat protein